MIDLEIFTKASGKMVISMVLECLRARLERNSMVNGKTTSHTDMASYLIPKEYFIFKVNS